MADLVLVAAWQKPRKRGQPTAAVARGRVYYVIFYAAALSNSIALRYTSASSAMFFGTIGGRYVYLFAVES
jgi:hypothetical protein